MEFLPVMSPPTVLSKNEVLIVLEWESPGENYSFELMKEESTQNPIAQTEETQILINVMPGETPNTKFRIRAIDPCGYAGPYSEPLYVEFGPAPPQQTDVVISVLDDDSCAIEINWTTVEDSEYPIKFFAVDV
jgi:hypothetical protein